MKKSEFKKMTRLLPPIAHIEVAFEKSADLPQVGQRITLTRPGGQRQSWEVYTAIYSVKLGLGNMRKLKKGKKFKVNRITGPLGKMKTMKIEPENTYRKPRFYVLKQRPMWLVIDKKWEAGGCRRATIFDDSTIAAWEEEFLGKDTCKARAKRLCVYLNAAEESGKLDFPPVQVRTLPDHGY